MNKHDENVNLFPWFLDFFQDLKKAKKPRCIVHFDEKFLDENDLETAFVKIRSQFVFFLEKYWQKFRNMLYYACKENTGTEHTVDSEKEGTETPFPKTLYYIL